MRWRIFAAASAVGFLWVAKDVRTADFPLLLGALCIGSLWSCWRIVAQRPVWHWYSLVMAVLAGSCAATLALLGSMMQDDLSWLPEPEDLSMSLSALQMCLIACWHGLVAVVGPSVRARGLQVIAPGHHTLH